MQKGQAPGFKREQIELEPCSVCKGKAIEIGVFYELVCTECNGSGWVVRGSRLVLSSDKLVTQLTFKLQQTQREIAALKAPANVARSRHEKSNRLGSGGTNYTGD
jgi:hypothetical protein